MYLGYLNLAVWRCYISFLSRWCGSDVLLYGGLHTYSFVYVVDPFACRLRRPFLSRCLEMVGTAERSTCVGIWAPPYYFNHFRTSRLESRSVIHRGSYTWTLWARGTRPLRPSRPTLGETLGEPSRRRGKDLPPTPPLGRRPRAWRRGQGGPASPLYKEGRGAPSLLPLSKPSHPTAA